MSLIYERVFKDATEDVWNERKPEQFLISLGCFRFNSQLFGLPYLELPTISKAMGCGALLALKELVLGFFSPNANNCSSQAKKVWRCRMWRKSPRTQTQRRMPDMLCVRGEQTVLLGVLTLLNFWSWPVSVVYPGITRWSNFWNSLTFQGHLGVCLCPHCGTCPSCYEPGFLPAVSADIESWVEQKSKLTFHPFKSSFLSTQINI